MWSKAGSILVEPDGQSTDLPDPTFPPMLSGHGLDVGVELFGEACRRAATGEAGAGDVFWGRRTDRLQCAVVLEPEVSADHSLQMVYAAMLAFGDAFGAVAPPEIGMFYRWPATFLVNDAVVGMLQVALPELDAADVVPDWLVVAVDIAIMPDPLADDPGSNPDNTTLHDEGCAEVTRTGLVESFCRHFLVWINEWSDEGFEPLHRHWLQRARDHNEETTLDHMGKTHCGIFVGLDEDGNLLLRDGGGAVVSLSLFGAVGGRATGGDA